MSERLIHDDEPDATVLDPASRRPTRSYVNPDLAPTTLEQRRWGTKDIAALWISMSACIPTYMLASSLIAEGMNWWQAVAHDLPGQHDRAGADDPERARRHEVRHPVPGLLPGVVRHPGGERPGAACGPWSPAAGSASRPGSAAGRSTRSSPSTSRPGSSSPPIAGLGINAAQLACFLAFWAVNMVVIYLGIDSIRVLLNIKAPLLDRAGPGAAGLGLPRRRTASGRCWRSPRSSTRGSPRPASSGRSSSRP